MNYNQENDSTFVLKNMKIEQLTDNDNDLVSLSRNFFQELTKEENDSTFVLENMNRDFLKKKIEQLTDKDLMSLSRINDFFRELTKEEVESREVKRVIDYVDKKYIVDGYAESSLESLDACDTEWSKRFLGPFTDKGF